MRQRTLYHLSKMIAERLNKGEDYQEIAKTVAINILDFDLLGEETRFHNVFRFLETETHKELTDAGEIHFMEMPVLRRYIERHKEGITEIIGKEKLLDWLLFIDNPDSEYAKLAESSNDAIGRAKDMLKTLSADEKLREEYLAREKAIMDHYASLKAAEKYGREEGKEEGREEGIGLGEERKGIRMAKNLHKMGIPLYQISEASEISIDELKQILKI
jgi:predicted transposase/invertase (TIGR01784 family)